MYKGEGCKNSGVETFLVIPTLFILFLSNYKLKVLMSEIDSTVYYTAYDYLLV